MSAGALAAVACGGGGGNPLPTGPTPVTANIEFVATTETTTEATTEATADAGSSSVSACTGLVRLHPSWWSFAHVTMVAMDGDAFGLFFDQVPIGRHSVRLTLPEGCESTGLVANGVALRADDNGAFVFTIDSDGRITP